MDSIKSGPIQSNDSRKIPETKIEEYEKQLSQERDRVQIINKSYEDMADKKEALERNLDSLQEDTDTVKRDLDTVITKNERFVKIRISAPFRGPLIFKKGPKSQKT